MNLQPSNSPKYTGVRGLLASVLLLSACGDDASANNTEGHFSASNTDASSSTTGSTGPESSSTTDETGDDTTASTTTSDTSTSATEGMTDTGENLNCGDGILDEGEVCDDGNTNNADFCSEDCSAEQRIMTIASPRSNGALGGVEDADQMCAKIIGESEKITIPDTAFVQAWLSDGEVSPATRLPDFEGHYVDANGVVIAESHGDLLGLNLSNPLMVDENGEEVSGSVWSNVGAGGLPFSTEYHCEEWTTGSGDEMGFTGQIGAQGDQWTSDTAKDCNSILRLLCIVGEKK